MSEVALFVDTDWEGFKESVPSELEPLCRDIIY